MSLKMSKIKKLLDFKKILVAIGILAIASSVSLSVVACDNTQIEMNQDQTIVDAINKVDTYKVTIPAGSNIRSLFEKTDRTFILNKLDKNIQNIFNWPDFVIVTFLKNDKNLLDEDLLNPTIIDAKICYHYGKIKYQFTQLVINVVNN